MDLHHIVTMITVVLAMTALIVGSIALSEEHKHEDNSLLAAYIKDPENLFDNSSLFQLANEPVRSTARDLNMLEDAHTRGATGSLGLPDAGISIMEADGGLQHVQLKGPSSMDTSFSITFPAAPPASDNLYLKSDPSGVLSFAEGGSTKLNNIDPATSAATLDGATYDVTITTSGDSELKTTGGDVSISNEKTNGNVGLKTNGTGMVLIGNGANAGQISSRGSYDLKLSTNSDTNSGYITITDGTNGDITIDPHGSGNLILGSADNTEVDINAEVVDINAGDDILMNAVDDILMSSGGDFSIDVKDPSAINIGTSVDGAYDTSAINIGTSATPRTITIGDAASTKVDVNALIIELDSANTIVTDSTSTTTMTSSGNFLIDAANGSAINIGTSADVAYSTSTINIGTSSSARTINIGGHTTSSTLATKGAHTHTGTFTVGANGDGHDVQFYGATTGASLHWDKSEDQLKLVNAATSAEHLLNLDNNANVNALKIDSASTTGSTVHITSNSLTTGSGISLESSSNSTSARNLVDITATGTAATGLTCLSVSNASVASGSGHTVLFETSAAETNPLLELKNTNADANGPILRFNKNGASPADDDYCGTISFYGEDDGNTATEFAKIEARAIDISNTTENGSVIFTSMVAGAAREVARINPESLTANTFMGGFGYKQPVFTAANGSLTAAMSGSYIIHTGATAATITLPTVTAADIGTFYTFIITTAHATNFLTVQTGGSTAAEDDFIGGVINVTATAQDVSAGTDNDTQDTTSFSAPAANDGKMVFDADVTNCRAQAGSYVRVTAIAASAGGGTDVWFVEGRLVSDAITSTGAELFQP